jgi:hypothetical protein
MHGFHVLVWLPQAPSNLTPKFYTCQLFESLRVLPLPPLYHLLGLSSHQSLSTTDLPLLCTEVSRISPAMAHILAIVLSILLVLGIVVSVARSFAETEYIDMIPDKIQDLESGLFEMLGTNPLYVHFAEFSLRYGKRYSSVC